MSEASPTDNTVAPVCVVPYREFVLSTLKEEVPAETKAYLLDSNTTLFDFWAKIDGQEKESSVNKLRWNIPADVMMSLAQNIIHASDVCLDGIANVPAGQHTFANTLGASIAFDHLSDPYSSSLQFISNTSSDKAIRDASNEAKEFLEAAFVKSASRFDVYLSMKAFSETEEAKALTGEYKRVLDHTMRDFRRNGMDLDQEQRDKLVALKTRMSSIAITFQKNLAEENTTYTFTSAQLAGLTEDQLSAFKKIEVEGEEAKYEVTLQVPHYIAVMTYCSVVATRKQMEFGYNTRCLDTNTPLMEELIVLRGEMAQLLGYPNFAAYALEIKMANTPDIVMDFLANLSEKIQPLHVRDVQFLLDTKKQWCEENNVEFDGEVYPYDRAFFSRIYEEHAFSLDQKLISEYLPTQEVVPKVFSLLERILQVKFVKLDVSVEKKTIWHEDAVLYEVRDRETNNVMGQLYLDLFPREGKYGHAAVFPLISAHYDVVDGVEQRVMPVVACVCNFPKKSETQPALLKLNDFRTYMHELGHVVHALFSDSKTSRMSSFNVPGDFVECPSQALEQFHDDKDVMKMVMSHYSTHSLPDESVFDNIIKSRISLSGAFNTRQLTFAIVDMEMHSHNEKPDTAAKYKEVMERVQHTSPTPGTNMIAGFGHLASDLYAAGYYGYLFSEAYAIDVYTELKKALEEPAIGKKYRDVILAGAAKKDAEEIFQEFMGRKLDFDNFLKSKGL